MNKEYLTKLAENYRGIGDRMRAVANKILLLHKDKANVLFILANDYIGMSGLIEDALEGKFQLEVLIQDARKPWGAKYLVFKEKRLATMEVQLRAIERGL